MERRPCRCGDRPGGWVPAGMSRNDVPFAKERQNYTLSRRVAQGGGKKHETRAIRRGRKDGTADSDACIDSKETRPP